MSRRVESGPSCTSRSKPSPEAGVPLEGRCHVELQHTVSGPAPRIRTEDGVTIIPVLEVGQAENQRQLRRRALARSPWVTRNQTRKLRF
jgi:hypothetical protein